MKLLRSTVPMLHNTSMPMLGEDGQGQHARTGDALVRARMYQSHKWRGAAHAYLKAHDTCVRCGEPSTIVDHRLGHSGDWLSRFWNRSFWQALCASCHSRKTMTEERPRARALGADLMAGGVGLKLEPRLANQALLCSVKGKFSGDKRG